LPGTVVLKRPPSCDPAELAAFETLVRESGEVAERGLPVRIRAAACLAFYYAPQGDLAAIAALKVPRKSYRDRVFRAARTRRRPDAYPLELGWFFVRPAHRGRRMSQRLAAPLLEQERDRAVFATARIGNSAMLKVLSSLGFERTGTPYPHDGTRPKDALVLLVRPGAPGGREGTGRRRRRRV
jgi:GNAT superfamily N-acetyltransferase